MVCQRINKGLIAEILRSVLCDKDTASEHLNVAVNILLKKMESDDFDRTARLIILGLSISELLHDHSLRNKKGLLNEFFSDSEYYESVFMTKYGLSKDDIITLKMFSEGLTNSEISEKLSTISDEGVAKRVKRILLKLRAKNRVQAAVFAVKAGIG